MIPLQHDRRWLARLWPLIGLLGGCLALVLENPVRQSVGSATSGQPVTVFLVRHAEKLTGEDPELSPVGRQRAAQLAVVLGDAGVQHVHSSDFRRTRQTAAPLAERRELDVSLYDAGDLPALAGAIRDLGGRHLVVGHSNTTPALAELLGGQPGAPIREADEYDRLYVITIPAEGPVSTVMLRYASGPEGR